jgi:heat shock protein HtpX
MSGVAKTAVLLGALAGLFIVVGGAIGGSGGAVVAFVFAVVFNAGSYWFSDRIVLRMHNAQPVGTDHVLYRVTQRMAQKAGLPMPRVYVIASQSPNAFATGRNPDHAAVAATQGLLDMLSEPELEGVIAHELTHVKNYDTLISTVAATMAAAIMMLVQVARFGMFFGGGRDDDRGQNPIAMLAMIILAPLAAVLIQASISRGREYAADHGGADITGSPMGLAHALQKIEAGARQIPLETSPATAHLFIMKPFWGEGMMSLFSSHPPTDARVKALMAWRPGS